MFFCLFVVVVFCLFFLPSLVAASQPVPAVSVSFDHIILHVTAHSSAFCLSRNFVVH